MIDAIPSGRPDPGLRRRGTGGEHLGRRAGSAARYLEVALLTVALAACGAPSEGPYRDTGKPMGATTRFDANRFAGDWQVVARFGTAPDGPMQFDAARGTLAETGRGREFAVNDRNGIAVMWVDDGFRTAALGSVDGRIGFILDRTLPGAPDRIAAARDIMAFYGWDVGRLDTPD